MEACVQQSLRSELLNSAPKVSSANPDPLYSTPEAAPYLGMSESWLTKANVYGTGPKFVKIGRKVLYRKSDLDAFIAARVRNSTSEPMAA